MTSFTVYNPRQAGIDQQPVETPGLRAVSAAVELAMAALQNLFLFGKAGIERHAGCFLHHQRQVSRVQRVKRRGQTGRCEIHRIDCIIGGQIARIQCLQAASWFSLCERGR
jgi:hypothetical protein